MRSCRSGAGETVLERALAAEMTGHLGCETHDPAVRGSGSSRNCTTPKTALTDLRAVDLAVPRRDAGGARSSRVVLGRVCVADSAGKVRYRTQIWSSSGPM